MESQAHRVIEYRTKVLVNTDPQRRCYYGHHYKSEMQWTAWSELEVGIRAERAEARLTFWRELNDYAVKERGEDARREFRLKPT